MYVKINVNIKDFVTFGMCIRIIKENAFYNIYISIRIRRDFGKGGENEGTGLNNGSVLLLMQVIIETITIALTGTKLSQSSSESIIINLYYSILKCTYYDKMHCCLNCDFYFT